jgi:hypothetical protein
MAQPSAFLDAPKHPRRAWNMRSWKPHQTGKTKREAFSGVKSHWSRVSHKRPMYSIGISRSGKTRPRLVPMRHYTAVRVEAVHPGGELVPAQPRRCISLLHLRSVRTLTHYTSHGCKDGIAYQRRRSQRRSRHSRRSQEMPGTRRRPCSGPTVNRPMCAGPCATP